MKADIEKKPEQYTIVELQMENLQRIKAVRIRPDGALVAVTGKNGAGKSSIFDAIEAAIEGARVIKSEPIRRGADEGVVRLDLGEISVERTFAKRDDGSLKTEVRVMRADGSPISRPQEVLNSFFGKLSFDPLAFDRLDAKGKFEALRPLVAGVDFEAIARADKKDRDQRLIVGRDYERVKAHAGSIAVGDDVPEAPIDTEALRATIASARNYNADIDARRVRREGAEQAIEERLDKAEKLRAEAAELEAAAEALQKKLGEAPALPAKQDIDELERELERAMLKNSLVDKRAEKTKAELEAKALGKSYDDLTKQIESRIAAKQTAIAKAKLPAGVSFTEDDTILLGGVPFEQASTAERIRAAVELAMAMNPKLKVICIREGSLLDKASLAMIAKIAEERGYQVWLEVVRDDDMVGFVIEDGELAAVNGRRVHA